MCCCARNVHTRIANICVKKRGYSGFLRTHRSEPFTQVAATIDDGNKFDETVHFVVLIEQEGVVFDQHSDARADVDGIVQADLQDVLTSMTWQAQHGGSGECFPANVKLPCQRRLLLASGRSRNDGLSLHGR